MKRHPIQISLKVDEYERFSALCDAEGVRPSTQARALLLQWLAKTPHRALPRVLAPGDAVTPAEPAPGAEAEPGSG